jgi:ubiquinone/menaquinone biosynthesis C-methylase UbiE
MLDQARRKRATGGVVLLRTSAQALPFSDRGADLVFMSMVYHHLADPYRCGEGMPPCFA